MPRPAPFRAPVYAAQTRAERLIAGGRVALAVSSLFAVWLDPTEPAKDAEIAYGLLAAYVVYSLAVAAQVSRTAMPSPRRGWVTHLVDLVFFSGFVYFTAGPASPFNAYFVFSLVCASLRWSWRETLGTAVVAMTASVAIGVAATPAGAEEVLRPFIIRGVYLGVMAALLGYLGAHERAAHERLALLAGWPEPGSTRLDDLARDLVEHARTVLAAPDAVLVWLEREEPWLYVARSSPAGFTFTRESPARFAPIVAAELESSDFLVRELEGESSKALLADGAGFRDWLGSPLHVELARALGAGSLLALRLPAASVEGRLLFLDVPALDADHLVLGQSVAAILASRLDRAYVGRSVRETAAMEERIRLARDLHDGVLQSLAGIGLRLAAIRRQLGDDPAAAGARLAELQKLIALEQRDLRFFIRDIRPPVLSDQGETPGIADRLEELSQRLEVEWGLSVELERDGIAEAVPEGLAREVYPIVRETLVNAVRHGEARRARLSIARRDASLRIVVSDDGKGFPFHGRFDAAALGSRDLGPKTLRERVAALGGDLVLESSPAGARIEVALPLAAAEPHA